MRHTLSTIGLLLWSGVIKPIKADGFYDKLDHVPTIEVTSTYLQIDFVTYSYILKDMYD